MLRLRFRSSHSPLMEDRCSNQGALEYWHDPVWSDHQLARYLQRLTKTKIKASNLQSNTVASYRIMKTMKFISSLLLIGLPASVFGKHRCCTLGSFVTMEVWYLNDSSLQVLMIVISRLLTGMLQSQMSLTLALSLKLVLEEAQTPTSRLLSMISVVWRLPHAQL